MPVINTRIPSSIPSNIAESINTRDPLQALKEPLPGATAGESELFFPEELDEIDHFVTIRAYQTEQVSRREASKEKLKASIRLPLPGNLGTAYSINYIDNEFIGLGNTILEAFSNGSAEDRAAISGSMAEMGFGAVAGGGAGALFGGNALSGAIAGASVAALAGPNSQRAGIAEAGASGLISTNTLAQGILANRGLAVNPHKVLMFQNVGFRSHQFNYQFTPKSYKEAVALKQIIYKLKYHSAPSYPGRGRSITFDNENTPRLPGVDNNITVNDISQGKHFFEYPEFFTIEFNHPKFLFSIGPSVIETINVDYHPAGMPTYNREGGGEPTPSQINLTISFRETEIVTKNVIGDSNR